MNGAVALIPEDRKGDDRSEAVIASFPRLRICIRWTARVLLRLMLILAPVVIAGMIAWNTAPGTHPDEAIHVNAFEYFRTHWLRPAPGSSEVAYSLNGWSRVFNGEIVYFLYGKAGYFPRHIWPNLEPTYIYRFCNIALLLITLTILAWARCALFPPWLLAILLVCIPQVLYVFSYANSDAFGVAMSVLLFLQSARMMEQPPRQWSVVRIILFMLLLLLTLLSKVGFEMDILLPLGLIIFHLIRTRVSLKWIGLKMVVPVLVVYAVAAWWNPQLSPARSEWSKQMMAMRQQVAVADRRPIDTHHPWGLYMSTRHWSYAEMLRYRDHWWLWDTMQSFYARFGYMTIAPARWIYATAAYTALGLLAFTLILQLVYICRATWELMLCMFAAPALLALNLFGSLYHSLYFDWQPQGRYLFASLIPIFFLCFGSCAIEGRWWRLVHGLVVAALIALSGYVLIEYAALNPALRS